jgi:hypothetical protein
MTSLTIVKDLVARCVEQHPELRRRMEHAAFIAIFRIVRRRDRGDHISQTQWEVGSETDDGKLYAVHTTAGSCTCPDYQRAPHGWCKHRLAVQLVVRAEEEERRAQAAAVAEAERQARAAALAPRPRPRPFRAVR